VAHLEVAWACDDDSASSTDGSAIQISPGRTRSSVSSASSITGGYNSALINPDFDLTLDDRSVLAAIRQLNFIQMKRKLQIK